MEPFDRNTLFLPYQLADFAAGAYKEAVLELELDSTCICGSFQSGARLLYGVLTALCVLSQKITGEKGPRNVFIANEGKDAVPVEIELQPEESFLDAVQKIELLLQKDRYAVSQPSGRKFDKTLIEIITTFPNLQQHAGETWDLVFSLIPTSSGMTVQIRYNSIRYEKQYLVDLMDYFRQMIGWLSAHACLGMNCWQGAGPILRGPVRELGEQTLPDELSRAFARFCDKLACEDHDQAVSYRWLSEHSDLAAAWFINTGYKGQVIGLYMKKSITFYVMVLALLKAGCVCMPLDSRQTAPVVDHFAEQGDCRLVITDASDTKLQTPYITALQVMEDAQTVPKMASVKTLPGDRFLIFTTGSSGEPKGVLLNDQGIINHLRTKIRILHLGEEDVVAHGISIGFVASIWLFLAPVLVGAKIAFLEEGLSLQDTLTVYSAKKITVLTAVPSLLKAIIQASKQETGITFFERNTLRWIVSTGEELDAALAAGIMQYFPGIRLMNAYGQTECSDDTLHYVCDKEIPPHKVIPIGVPADNTVVYITGHDGGLLPAGAVGEIVIESPGVAARYGRHEPVNQTTYPAFYTGDLGWIDKEGQVIYAGRDVSGRKINGCKVSVNLLCRAVREVDGIEDAAVCIDADENNRQSIYVYYLSPEEIPEYELKKLLMEQLPWYMCPQRCIRVSSFPKLVNGKTDYRALKAKYSRQGLIEQNLADYLNHGQEDFIISGGDSLSLAIMAAKLKQKDKNGGQEFGNSADSE